MSLLIYVNAKLERFDDMSIISSNIVANHNYYALMYKTLVQYTGTTKRTKYHRHVGKETADIRNFTY